MYMHIYTHIYHVYMCAYMHMYIYIPLFSMLSKNETASLKLGQTDRQMEYGKRIPSIMHTILLDFWESI